MATEGRRRRQGKNKPKKRASRKDQGPTTVHDIPGHLFELILLRLDSSLCLIPGHYCTVDPYYELSPLPGGVDGRGAIFVPSSPLTVHSRRFSLGFLRDSGSWELADCRGSLLLLVKESTGWAPWRRSCFRDLIVCEPLTGRYERILFSADLKGLRCLGMVLLDGGGGDADGGTGGRINMSSFRIICALYETHEWYSNHGASFACVFTPGSDGGWRVTRGAAAAHDIVLTPDSLHFVGRAGGSLYWGIEEDDAVLALDEATAEFSLVLLPANVRASHYKRTLRVLSGDDGGGPLRVVRLMGEDLKVFARLPGSVDEWVLEKLLSLPEATHGLPGREERFFQRVGMIVAATASYILLTPNEKTWLFSVDVETMEVEREHERNKYAGAAYPYELPWPPALQACADHSGGRRRGPS